MMKNINDVGNRCYGCRACENICPKKCIKMVEDDDGFIYPSIENQQCINCGLCSNVCQVKNSIDLLDIENSYGFTSYIDSSIKSASGGICDVLSRFIIKKSGIVFGAKYTDDFKVIHEACDSEQELSLFQSSKYVTSDTLYTYSEVKKELDSGKIVLYIGTSCQIAGLLLFLRKKYDNLYTISLICHGVPSFKAFRLYLDSIEKKYNDIITHYNFRYKGKEGHGLYLRIDFKTHKPIYRPMIYDTYGKDFLEGNNYRYSCYSCKYACLNRVSDFSVGDYWGVEKFYPKLKDELGVSAILVNTQKGFSLIDEISKSGDLFESSIENIIERQVNLKHPTIKPPMRENYYQKISMKYYARNVVPFTAKLKMLIPNGIKRIIKKILNK